MRHKLKFLMLIFALAACGTLRAQNLSTILSAQGTSANCSAASGTTTSSVSVAVSNPNSAPTNAAFSIASSGSQTVTFYVSANNGATWTTFGVTPSAGGALVTTASGNGNWSQPISGYTNFCAVATTYASGSAVVSITLSTSGGGSGGGGSGSGFAITCSTPDAMVAWLSSGNGFCDSAILTNGLGVLTIAGLSGAPAVNKFGYLCPPGDVSIFCLKDEFVGGLGTIANVGVGDLHWGVSTVSSASTYASIAGAFPNLGIFQWTTAAGQGDGTSMQLSSTGASVVAPLGNLGGNAPWDSEFIVKMGSLAATRMRVGYANALAGCQTSIITSINASCDGFWVRYDTSAPAVVNVGNNGITRSAGGVVTVTVATHSMTLVGQTVTIAGATGCTTSPNGTFPVASIPSATTYTFAQAGAAETCGGNAPATSTPNAATTYFIESKSGAATPVAVAQDTAVTGVTTFVRIRIQSEVPGTIIYSLYGPSGTLLAGPTSIASDVATTNMAPTVQFVSDTAGTKVIQADYWSFAATGLAR